MGFPIKLLLNAGQMYGVKVTQNVTQYPRHHVTYAQAKFEVATSKSL